MNTKDIILDTIERITKHTLAFDLHGVIDVDPINIMSRLMRLRAAGHRVLLISGPPTNQIYDELRRMDIDASMFDQVHSIVDYLKGKGVHMTKDDNGNYWASDAIWWASKAQICKENKVDFMFDDTFAYSAWFIGLDTEFIHINNKDFRSNLLKSPKVKPALESPEDPKPCKVCKSPASKDILKDVDLYYCSNGACPLNVSRHSLDAWNRFGNRGK